MMAPAVHSLTHRHRASHSSIVANAYRLHIVEKGMVQVKENGLSCALQGNTG